jgi:hypothetical protein
VGNGGEEDGGCSHVKVAGKCQAEPEHAWLLHPQSEKTRLAAMVRCVCISGKSSSFSFLFFPVSIARCPVASVLVAGEAPGGTAGGRDADADEDGAE